MRTAISMFAGLALLAGAAARPASAQAQDPQPLRTITLTAGQGGSLTIVLPEQVREAIHSGPAQTVVVTAGQAGSISTVVPGPSVEFVAAAKAPANGSGDAQTAALRTRGNN